MKTHAGPSAWWQALESLGLDNLSAPELAVAVQELAQDRPAFVGLLAAANDYPRVGLCEVRRPDRGVIAALDEELPRSRAVLLPDDERGLQAALGAFEVVLVLDPLWQTGDLLYACWHARQGISPEHTARLHQRLAPAVRLSDAREAIRFIPDHLPGSWDPFPVPVQVPLRQAASLVYWANCLRGIAVAAQPDVAASLRDLLQAGPDLQGGGGREVPVRPHPATGHIWAEVFDALEEDPSALVPLLPSFAENPPWQLGVGAPALPEVSLALLRTQAGRPIRSGIPGKPFPLARRPVYLIG